jgi:uroporphyrinogen decarboxylase
MTPKQRFLTAINNQLPDRIPAAPDISNYIPCKRTGLPFWDIYFFGHVPLWRAYLEAMDYFGGEAWVGSCASPPIIWADPVEYLTRDEHDFALDAFVRRTRVRTPDGELTCASTCFRREPPTPTEKLIKDLERDWSKYRWLLTPPSGIHQAEVATMRLECDRRQQALGFCVSYCGFQYWESAVQGGIETLAYALADCPHILEEWLELDLIRGTRVMELALSAKPDYILLGGSGTITLASPQLARRYALPAIRKYSAMAKAAGVPTMLHSCGRSRVLVEMLADETDVSSVNPLEHSPMGDVDLADVKRTFGSRIGLMGNLHTTNVMLRGTPAQVRAAAVEAMRAAGPGGGFVLSTGDQCGRDTPDENIFALIEAAKELGVYDPQKGRLPRLAAPAAA